MAKNDFPNPSEDILRIIYWVRRYRGFRDKDHGKIWTAGDLNIMEKRIEQYCKTPSKFNYDNPNMGIDDYGLTEDNEGEDKP